MHPVHLRLCAVAEPDLADTSLMGRGKSKRFLIRIRPELDYQFAVYLLSHEWAHAVAWNPEAHPALVDHDEVWGIAFSRVYRALIPGAKRAIDVPRKE